MASALSYFPATYQNGYAHVPVYQAQQYGYNMPQQQGVQHAQPSNAITWVANEQEATMNPVAPNNVVALWDSNNPVLYLKQADASGKPSMIIYDLIERQKQPSDARNAEEGKHVAYATKDELAALAGVVKSVDDIITDLRNDIDAIKSHKTKGDE